MIRFSDGYGDFPHHSQAQEDGLIAIGASLAPDRLIHAYENGIFPWYNEGEPIMWFCPRERCVLTRDSFHISKSFSKWLKKNQWTVTHNQAFERVIRQCAEIPRAGQDGDTWIHNDMIKAYTELHHLGQAHSFEVWDKTELVGGIYGIIIGDIFCGESMFSQKSNASKFALYKILFDSSIQLIDTQIPNNHLISLGAYLIPAENFIEKLKIEKNFSKKFVF